MLLVAVGVLVSSTCESFALTSFGAVLTGAGEGLVGPVLMAYAALAVSGRMRTLALAAYLTAGSVAGGIANVMQGSRSAPSSRSSSRTSR